MGINSSDPPSNEFTLYAKVHFSFFVENFDYHCRDKHKKFSVKGKVKGVEGSVVNWAFPLYVLSLEITCIQFL